MKDKNAGDVLHTNDPWGSDGANTDEDDIYVWYQYWQEGSGTTPEVTDREADTIQNGGINNYDKNNDKIGLKPGEQISVIIRVFADDNGSFGINDDARIVIDANASDAERLQPS